VASHKTETSFASHNSKNMKKCSYSVCLAAAAEAEARTKALCGMKPKTNLCTDCSVRWLRWPRLQLLIDNYDLLLAA